MSGASGKPDKPAKPQKVTSPTRQPSGEQPTERSEVDEATLPAREMEKAVEPSELDEATLPATEPGASTVFNQEEFEDATAPIAPSASSSTEPTAVMSDEEGFESATSPATKYDKLVLVDDDDDDDEEASTVSPVNDRAKARMRMAQDALAELESSVALEIKYGAAASLSVEEQNERAFRKLALFGTRADRVMAERKAEADKLAAQRKAAEATVKVAHENSVKAKDMQSQQAARMAYQYKKAQELDIELKPLPDDWSTREYNLPVIGKEFWANPDAVFFCGDCKQQLLSAPTDPMSRHRCISCGQIYCSYCCPLVGSSTQHKELGKFRACGLCVQTTLAVAAKLKNQNDKNDQLRRVLAEKVGEQGEDHCLVVGCKEVHRQHYCKYCKNKDAAHFSNMCPKAPKKKK